MLKKGHRNFAIGCFLALPVVMKYFDFKNNLNYMNNEYSLLYIGLFLIITVIAAKLPDYDLKLKNIYGDPQGKKRYLYHRQWTHSLLLWSLFGIGAIYYNNVYLFYFVFGGFTHLLGDIVTGSIPIALYGKYYNWWSRVGVDRVYPKPAFWNKVTKWLDIISPVFIVIGIAINVLYFFVRK